MRAKPPGPTLLLQWGVLPNVTFISAGAAVGMQPPKASPAFWQAASLASRGATDAFIMWEVQSVAPDKNEDSGVIGQNVCCRCFRLSSVCIHGFHSTLFMEKALLCVQSLLHEQQHQHQATIRAKHLKQIKRSTSYCIIFTTKHTHNLIFKVVSHVILLL